MAQDRKAREGREDGNGKGRYVGLCKHLMGEDADDCTRKMNGMGIACGCEEGIAVMRLAPFLMIVMAYEAELAVEL